MRLYLQYVIIKIINEHRLWVVIDFGRIVNAMRAKCVYVFVRFRWAFQVKSSIALFQAHKLRSVDQTHCSLIQYNAETEREWKSLKLLNYFNHKIIYWIGCSVDRMSLSIKLCTFLLKQMLTTLQDFTFKWPTCHFNRTATQPLPLAVATDATTSILLSLLLLSTTFAHHFQESLFSVSILHLSCLSRFTNNLNELSTE